MVSAGVYGRHFRYDSRPMICQVYRTFVVWGQDWSVIVIPICALCTDIGERLSPAGRLQYLIADRSDGRLVHVDVVTHWR